MPSPPNAAPTRGHMLQPAATGRLRTVCASTGSAMAVFAAHWRRISRPVRRGCGSRERGPEHKSIVVLDMAGFGRWDNRAQLRARTLLNAAVRAAFSAAGIGWSRLAVEDRGDGMIVFVPATVSKADLLDPFVPVLAALIGMLGHDSLPFHRIRVRIALHCGEVHRDDHGWAGADVNLACRLVNAEAAYRCLREHPDADLVLVVSAVIYDGIVRHGYRTIDPAAYRPIRVVAKEVDAAAWIHVRAGRHDHRGQAVRTWL